MSEILRIKDIMDNEEHPAHQDISKILCALENNEVSMCACLGKQGNDPFCPCGMRSRGLIPSQKEDWTQEKIDELNEVLKKYK